MKSSTTGSFLEFSSTNFPSLLPSCFTFTQGTPNTLMAGPCNDNALATDYELRLSGIVSQQTKAT